MVQPEEARQAAETFATHFDLKIVFEYSTPSSRHFWMNGYLDTTTLPVLGFFLTGSGAWLKQVEGIRLHVTQFISHELVIVDMIGE